MTVRRRVGASRGADRKDRTRQRLLDAALALMGDDGNLTGLSLRRVARRARVTPAAFYRHFESMEELGLSLLDGLAPALRELLRELRAVGVEGGGDRVAAVVDAFVRFVHERRAVFRLLVRERDGGPARIRRAIRRDLQHFGTELALELPEVFPEAEAASADVARAAAALLVEALLTAASQLLDAGEAQEPALREGLARQLAIIVAGVRAWP